MADLRFLACPGLGASDAAPNVGSKISSLGLCNMCFATASIPYHLPSTVAMARTKASAKKSAGGKAGAGKKKAGKRRYKPGTVALREIRKMQKSGKILLAKAPFARIVRKFATGMKTDCRFRKNALAAIQDAAEAFATTTLEAAVMLQLHRKRKTLVKKDVEYSLFHNKSFWA